MPARPQPPTPSVAESPIYLFAVLLCARRAHDDYLEALTRRQLARLGVQVVFVEPAAAGEAARG